MTCTIRRPMPEVFWERATREEDKSCSSLLHGCRPSLSCKPTITLLAPCPHLPLPWAQQPSIWLPCAFPQAVSPARKALLAISALPAFSAHQHPTHPSRCRSDPTSTSQIPSLLCIQYPWLMGSPQPAGSEILYNVCILCQTGARVEHGVFRSSLY